jgi:GH24 family phage-related lysozyme (muramidase)
MQADKTAFEELPGTHVVPTAVVGIAYHKTRQYEKEIYCNVSVAQSGYYAAAGFIFCHGKGESFENMVKQNKNGCNTAQAVKQLVMWFRIGKRYR